MGISNSNVRRFMVRNEMKPWINKLMEESDYNPQDKLTLEEVRRLFERAEEGLRTTNGDTARVDITVRQLLLLLRYFFGRI
jgi:hypothetical protein